MFLNFFYTDVDYFLEVSCILDMTVWISLFFSFYVSIKLYDCGEEVQLSKPYVFVVILI